MEGWPSRYAIAGACPSTEDSDVEFVEIPGDVDRRVVDVMQRRVFDRMRRL